jgi:hypothetical protein
MNRTSLSLGLAVLGISAPTNADLTFGGAQSVEMGGAGLDFPVDVSNNY